MANIRVTPETLEAQGKELEGYAQNIQEVLTSIETKIGEIIQGWDGLAQDSYYTMYENMKKTLTQFPELVSALAQATISAAGAFSEVDTTLQSSFSSMN